LLAFTLPRAEACLPPRQARGYFVKKYSQLLHSLFIFDNSSEIRSIGVSGKRRFKRCCLEFKRYRQGNVTIYACVKIVLKKDQLIWKLKKGTADFFPKKTILWLS
jgi:hypothetical protein